MIGGAGLHTALAAASMALKGSAASGEGGRPDAQSAWARFRIGIFVSLSNPKAILFGVAFFPQFIDRSLPLPAQAAILLLTFLVIETGWMCVYAGGGAQLAQWLRHGQRMRWFNTGWEQGTLKSCDTFSAANP